MVGVWHWVYHRIYPINHSLYSELKQLSYHKSAIHPCKSPFFRVKSPLSLKKTWCVACAINFTKSVLVNFCRPCGSCSKKALAVNRGKHQVFHHQKWAIWAITPFWSFFGGALNLFLCPRLIFFYFPTQHVDHLDFFSHVFLTYNAAQIPVYGC